MPQMERAETKMVESDTGISEGLEQIGLRSTYFFLSSDWTFLLKGRVTGER